MTKKILIVDDEPDMLKLVEFRIKSAGYIVTVATNGEDALSSIKKDPPDLVLLDLRLPKIDGYAVCKTMKSDDAFKHIPVIIFTASAGGNITEKAREIGADDYLTKPFDSEVMLQKIKKFIA